MSTWRYLDRFGLGTVDIHDRLRLNVFNAGRLWDESYLQQPNALLAWKMPSVEDVLLFAGEATDRVRPQTVHGAIDSGLRAAREIISAPAVF